MSNDSESAPSQPCARCHRPFRLRNDGMVRAHWTDGRPCSGSGHRPVTHLHVNLGEAGFVTLDFDCDPFDLEGRDRAFMFDILAQLSALAVA